jgi:hypothetical protein
MTLVSALLLVLASILRPVHAHCPRHAALSTGVDTRGRFACWLDESDRDDAVPIESRVYCTGGTAPIVVDGVAVACQRGGWR